MTTPSGRPPEVRRRRPAVDAPRRTAFDVLAAVRERDAYANLVLPGLLRERGLSGRDAALATELAYGALRGQGLYDAVIDSLATRPVDPPVRDVLRLGAHQLLSMRVPSHAAVSATVDLARRVLTAGPTGFVNALLRRISEYDRDAWVDRLAPPGDALGRAALATSHPRWVVQAFADALGGDVSEAHRALEHDEGRPAVHLVARRMAREALVEESGGTPGALSPHAVLLGDGGDPGALASVRDGRAGVQDEGSQLVALALAQAALEGRDETWVDLCAGPGGKASLLDAVAPGRLVAVELHEHRAVLVRRSGVERVVVADARRPPLPPGGADRVLLDAPCTGLGALRRRPESRWRRQPSDLPGLTKLQGELIDAAVALLRPGGVLLYATCSPHLAETRVPVMDALRRHPDLEQLDTREVLPGVPHLGSGPHVQLWPHRHGTDAMFLSLLRRRA